MLPFILTRFFPMAGIQITEITPHSHLLPFKEEGKFGVLDDSNSSSQTIHVSKSTTNS